MMESNQATSPPSEPLLGLQCLHCGYVEEPAADLFQSRKCHGLHVRTFESLSHDAGGRDLEAPPRQR